MLNHGELIFNGKSSRDFGLVIEQVPIFQKPTQKLHTYSVPGRSGDLIQKEQAWENLEISYNIWFPDADSSDISNFASRVSDIANWLYAPAHKLNYFKTETVLATTIVTGDTGEYCKLTDNFDTTHYRLAYFAGPASFETQLLKTGKATITFICQPQLYRNAGNNWTLNNLYTDVGRNKIQYNNLTGTYKAEIELFVDIEPDDFTRPTDIEYRIYCYDADDEEIYKNYININLPGDELGLNSGGLNINTPNHFSLFLSNNTPYIEAAQNYSQYITFSRQYEYPYFPAGTKSAIVQLYNTRNTRQSAGVLTGVKTHSWIL